MRVIAPPPPPPGPTFKAPLLLNEQGANTKRQVFEQLLKTCFRRTLFGTETLVGTGSGRRFEMSVQGGVRQLARLRLAPTAAALVC